MTWTDHAARGTERNIEHRPVVHDGRAIFLWHAEGASAIFETDANAWTPLRDPFGASGVRAGAVVVSTGRELIVWGGSAATWFGARDFKAMADGVRLTDGAWRPVADKRAPSQRGGAIGAWTGKEVLVWSGWKNGKPVKGGAAYDPATDTWRKMFARETAARVEDSLWSGRELWMWDSLGGRAGHAYEPTNDVWRPLATLPEARLHDRAMVKCGEGALLVCREGHAGSDLDGCVVWRYEPNADVWEPSGAPPPVRHAKPRLVDCDGRIVLGLGKRVFEYLPAKDAWAELPEPELDDAPHLLWLRGRLFAFTKSQTRSLELPSSGQALAAPAAPVVLAAAAPVALSKGAGVTAVALRAGEALAGDCDGKVTRNGEVLRKADGKPIIALAAHDEAWTCLVGDRLETRRGPGKAKVVELGFEGQALAHREGRLVVAGKGALASFDGASGWTLSRQVKTTGTTIHLALLGDTVARVIAGPEKKKGERKEPRDTVELRDALTLKTRETIVPAFASTTAAAVPVPDGTMVAGLGGYRMAHYRRGKKRATTELNADGYSRLAISADGNWLLAAFFEASLFDLRTGRRELTFEPRRPQRHLEPIAAIALDDDAKTIALGTVDGVTYVIDCARLGITAHPPTGSPVVLQPPASKVLERGEPREETEPAGPAKPDGQRDVHGWRRWHIGGRFLELPTRVAELVPRPGGGFVGRSRNELIILGDDGRTEAMFTGHGGDLRGLEVSPDGKHVDVWDREGLTRRWTL